MAKRKTNKLVKYGGKVVTAAQAATCVGKGFKGCTAAETRAVMKVVARMGEAALRRGRK